MLSDVVNYLTFEDPLSQSQHLAKQVADILSQAIESSGQASLAVSGGSTPKQMFELLSNTDIPWQHVTITLVDDRWVEPSHKDSNQQLIEQSLLQNFAQNAHFIGLYQHNFDSQQAVERVNLMFKQVKQPFDVVLLGMGNDGHTASLFPCSDQIQLGMSTSQLYLSTQPKSAPYSRISLSAKAITASQHIFIQLKGLDKQQTLEKALAQTDELKMPIKRFLTKNSTVLWCP
jgi:6-phosphogluconolactonase